MLTSIDSYVFFEDGIRKAAEFIKDNVVVEQAVTYKLNNGVSITLPESYTDVAFKPIFNECKGATNFLDLAYFYGLVHSSGVLIDNQLRIYLKPYHIQNQVIEFIRGVLKKYAKATPMIQMDEVNDTKVLYINNFNQIAKKLEFNIQHVPTPMFSMTQEAVFVYVYQLFSSAIEVRDAYELRFLNEQFANEVAMLLSMLCIPYYLDLVFVRIPEKAFKAICEKPQVVIIKEPPFYKVIDTYKVGFKPFVEIDCIGVNGAKLFWKEVIS